MKLFERFRTKSPQAASLISGRQGGANLPSQWGRERQAFYRRFFGQPLNASPELVPRVAGIEVLIYGPQQGRNFYTVITNGMSDSVMPPPPDGANLPRRIELFMRLPDVQVTPDPEALPWQVKLLLKIARLPADNRTWIGAFQEMTNGTPPKPICSGSKLIASILLPPIYENAAFIEGLTPLNGPHIDFLLLDFLTEAECAFRHTNGNAALLRLLENSRHTPVLNIHRNSYV